MSTRISIKTRQTVGHHPGFHLFEDCIDTLTDETDAPVYLELEGVQITELATHDNGVTVTIKLPREMARTLGLLP